MAPRVAKRADEEPGVEPPGSARLRLSAVLSGFAGLLERERPHWFLWWPVLFGAGIALYFGMTSEPELLTALMLPAGVLGMWIAAHRLYYMRLLLGALLIVGTGFAAAKTRTEWVRAPVLERQMGPVTVKGVVTLVEPRSGKGQRLTLDVISLGDLPADKRPARARIRTMVGLDGLKPGHTITVKAMLGPPAAPSMPGDYDFGRAAWYQRLGAIGYARSPPVLDGAARHSETGLGQALGETIERLRQEIGRRITAVLPGEQGAIATALITGERGAITTDTTNAFRDSGLLHILSISGLHMVIMAGAVFVLLRFLFATVPAIALRYPTKKWAAAAALVAAAAYLLISGSSVATVRSWFMTSIMLVAVLLDRPALSLRNVALAALVILALTPESLNDVGFQMSFAAVLSLIALYDALRGHLALDPTVEHGPFRHAAHFMLGIVLSTMAASIAVAPFAAYHFHKSQQYAIIANLIAIPVCNVFLMPAGLASLIAMPFGLEAAPLGVMGASIDVMTATATAVAALPGAVSFIPAIPVASLVQMVLGGLWLALWRHRWRYAGAALVAGGIALTPFGDRPDILAGRDGRLVALRQTDGTLALVMGRGAAFEARRWLERDGDPRQPAEAARATTVRCDGIGCTADVKGKRVAIARAAAALADDCREAQILVTALPRPDWCSGPATVIDMKALKSEGTHALYIADTGLVGIETVNRRRGARPWVTTWRPAVRRNALRSGRASDEAHEPSRADPTRPEVEDDEAKP